MIVNYAQILSKMLNQEFILHLPYACVSTTLLLKMNILVMNALLEYFNKP